MDPLRRPWFYHGLLIRTAPLPSGFASLAHFVTFLPPRLIMLPLSCLFIPIILFAAPWIPNREPIDPFISGDTFRAHCDFAYDEINPFLQPEIIPSKSTIFINGEKLGDFFERIHPQMKNAYILVVHNSDRAIPGCYRAYLDDSKLLALFTQNPDGTAHYKLHPLPIGIENRNWNSSNWEVLQKTKSELLDKIHLLYCNFNRHTFPSERTEVLDQFSKMHFTYTATRKPYAEFVRDLAISKFVLSPRGNGCDCFRTWEALYAGSYPIVRTSPLDPLFEGLPVVIVQNWDELTEAFLQKKFAELNQRTDYQWEKLYIDYYLDQINAAKQWSNGAAKKLTEGTTKLYTSEGKLFATEEFFAGKKHGVMTQYYPDGNVYRKTVYAEDLREGEETTYHQNGRVCE